MFVSTAAAVGSAIFFSITWHFTFLAGHWPRTRKRPGTQSPAALWSNGKDALHVSMVGGRCGFNSHLGFDDPFRQIFMLDILVNIACWIDVKDVTRGTLHVAEEDSHECLKRATSSEDQLKPRLRQDGQVWTSVAGDASDASAVTNRIKIIYESEGEAVKGSYWRWRHLLLAVFY